MTLELIELGPATLHRTRELERTPGKREPWVSEVEDFFFSAAVGTHVDEPASFILLAVDGEQAVGAVVHYPDDNFPGAEYVSTILIDHRRRGRGYGRELLRVAIEHAISASQRPHALWTVHPGNAPMLKLSEEVGELVDELSNGYRVFVRP